MEILIATLVSVVVQGVKHVVGTSTWGTRVLLLCVSFAAAAILYYLQQTNLWLSLVEIITLAAGVHALFLKDSE